MPSQHLSDFKAKLLDFDEIISARDSICPSGAGKPAQRKGAAVIRGGVVHLVVELMRQGKSPQAACEEAVERVYKKQKNRIKDIQVGFIALNKKGEHGAFCVQPGFNFAIHDSSGNKLIDSGSRI